MIDYGISNCPEKWSDRRLCRMSIISPGMKSVSEQFEVVPTNRYQPQCSEMFGEWTEQLLNGWAETKEEWANLCFQCEQQVNQICADQSQDSKQGIANEIWNQVNVFLERFLQKEAAPRCTTIRNLNGKKARARVFEKCPLVIGSLTLRVRQILCEPGKNFGAGSLNLSVNSSIKGIWLLNILQTFEKSPSL